MLFNSIYSGKRVLVTGHTGFKGSWLVTWLIRLGAQVIGVSLEPPTSPSMFNTLKLSEKIKHHCLDIRDLSGVRDVILEEKPDFIFHLAAQPIVSKSYFDPVETMSTNFSGTMNILEVLREVDWPCHAVLITSDKCYDNVEWVFGYRENDALGGKDIYSGSKAAAELLIKSYYHSFFKKQDLVKLAVARAGNVIGGGDWAQDRIVADSMRAWSDGKSVEIRSPNATRPWQHVLEPLSGYLLLGVSLDSGKHNGEAFNFGPNDNQNYTVSQLLVNLFSQLRFANVQQAYHLAENKIFHEAGLLKLNCDKALFCLQWRPNFRYSEMIKFTSEWYNSFYNNNDDMYELTTKQIEKYEALAIESEQVWTIS